MRNVTSKRLLIVGDDVLFINNEKIVLENYGYEVIPALNMKEAVRAVRNTNIDLILSDIDSNIDFYDEETSLENFEGCGIPILFIFSQSGSERVRKTEKISAYGYVSKSTGLEVLDASIKAALKLSDMNKQSGFSAEDLTINDQIKTELKKTRSMLFDVLNTIPLRVFWKNLDSVYLGCNKLFALDSGKSDHNDIIGLTDYDIRDKKQAELNRIDDNNIIKSGKPRINYEEPFPTCDDGRKWINTSKLPLYNIDGTMYGILGMYEDITERKRMEEEILLQKNRLANILYGSNVGTWEWNLQTGENIVNEYWARMIGYSLQELPVDQRDFWKQFIHPEDLERTNDLLNRHFNKLSDYFECEFRMRHKKGHWVWVLSRGKVSSWSEDGKPFLICGTHLDINDRRKAQEEIFHQLLEKETILKEVHHRIKNNFASICSLLSLQAATVGNEEAEAALLDAIGRVHSMQVLYEKLLLADNYSDASLKNYLDDLIEDILNVYPDKLNIRIEKQLCECKLDTKQLFPLGIIINELITNAMKYAFKGRDSGILRIILQESDGLVSLVIHDNGNGLPEGFDVNKKNGFGLMLVKIFSEQLKGKFTIENADGTKNTLVFKSS